MGPLCISGGGGGVGAFFKKGATEMAWIRVTAESRKIMALVA